MSKFILSFIVHYDNKLVLYPLIPYIPQLLKKLNWLYNIYSFILKFQCKNELAHFNIFTSSLREILFISSSGVN